MTSPAETRLPTVSRRRTAYRIDVAGVAQGIGFRPFVHRLASRNDLTGWIRNESGGVAMEVEGRADALVRFVTALREDAPPLARLDAVEVQETPLRGFPEFRILESREDPERRQPVSPDVAVCDACRAELGDPANRRYRYPFVTCTDCGPRFTIIDSMPYDRERTSMAPFSQCSECLEEYGRPADRRYRSETNSCPACGPRVWLRGSPGARSAEGSGLVGSSAGTPGEGAGPGADQSMDSIRAAARLLREGRVVAVRGLGGFHLAVDATNQAAVRRLRRRKRRDAKPVAVMAASMEEVRRVARPTPGEEELLSSSARPIVLLEKRSDSRLADAVAPDLDTVGVMLAYTPLHLLLLEEAGRPLVMTSGNVTDEPLATGNADALERLEGIADAFLLHDREIVSRCDDSVLRLVDDRPVFLRRARGYAPLPLAIPRPSPRPLVAVGPHLKNTLALVHRDRAYVSPHVGDLENLETLEAFRESLRRLADLYRVEPEVAVRDLHPGYLSSREAEELGVERVVSVQHHHAHVAAVAAEHDVGGPVLGLAYDGTGYGDDGRVWGGELLVADLFRYRRVAHLRYAPLPGGDLAVRNPWRVALGYSELDSNLQKFFSGAFEGIDERELAVARGQLRAGLNSPEASSMGRLFDAAAAVLGVRRTCRYQAQAAMELEALAGDRPARPLPFTIGDAADGTWILDPIPTLAALGDLRARGRDPSSLAARFHETVVAATATLVERVARGTGLDRVVLSGGVFQNARVLAGTRSRLEAAGFRVLVPRRLGPGDGAISYGQAAVGAATLAGEGG